MRRFDFKRPNSGSYVVAYQRNGEPPKGDVAFFDGDKSLSELKLLHALLNDAIKLLEEWEAEDKIE